MPIELLAGFATRPEASKLFNRSQRQLERDLDVANLAEDDEVLSRFKLMTKDGEVRDAKDVTTQQVKKLQSEGMIPVWYVETSYLEQEYGRKGEPKPAKSRGNLDANVTLQKVPNKTQTDPAEGRPDAGESDGAPSILSDAAFLQERIRTLEEVREALTRFGAVEVCRFVPSLFADTLSGLDVRPALVMIDVDLIESARDCLRFPWPRLAER